MGYSLPALSLSLEACKNIQRYAITQFLPAMGYERNMPGAVVFRPSSYGGIGIRHLYTEMACKKIESMISHIGAQTALGKTMCININSLQLCIGLETPMFETQMPISYIDNNWLLHI
jgi:hypothetical protein